MITFLLVELPALADHEFCLTTITPGRHCWCCWRICEAVCWTAAAAAGATAGLSVGVIETDTIAGWPPLGLLDEAEVAEDAGEGAMLEVVAAAAGVVRNFRYGSSWLWR